MNQSIIYPHTEEAVADSKTTTKDIISVAEASFPTPPYERNRNAPVLLSLAPAHSFEEQLDTDRKLVQFVLSEAEAAFVSPVRHFFNPGGQQLQYNQN
ncbi:hypothetical protein [Spirosoma koreense]